LKPAAVLAIYRSDKSAASLAAEHKCSKSTVYAIRAAKRWTWLLRQPEDSSITPPGRVPGGFSCAVGLCGRLAAAQLSLTIPVAVYTFDNAARCSPMTGTIPLADFVTLGQQLYVLMNPQNVDVVIGEIPKFLKSLESCGLRRSRTAADALNDITSITYHRPTGLVFGPARAQIQSLTSVQRRTDDDVPTQGWEADLRSYCDV
jgi:hypothetical protein